MKKLLIGSLFLMMGLGVFAQAGTGYFAIMPGYQFSTGNYQEDGFITFGNRLYQWRVNGSGENNFIGSLDGGYFFTENMGLHFAYIYNAGRFQLNGHLGPYYLGNYKFDQNINIVQLGPEFAWRSGADGQTYVQVNLGYTFGNSTPTVHTPYGHVELGEFGNQTFVYGAALGYRFYFNDSVGMGVQVAYNHFQNYGISDMWDGRIGVVWRFK